MVQCRICKGDHWTTQCPYKDSLAGGGGLVDNENGEYSVAEICFSYLSTYVCT